MLTDVARAYGIEDMYKDINSDDSMKFEKLLSKLESTSAIFIRKIWSGEALSLTRRQLAEMKKFLGIMMYRGEHRRGQYYNMGFDFSTLLMITKHMQHNNIARVQDVWFENLKWLIETPMELILEEYFRAMKHEDPMAILINYQGPIHGAELVDFGVFVEFYVCIWEAEEGSEFILSEGCFGSFEGHNGICFHNFFVVSPRYAIVMTNRHYMRGTMKLLPLRKSWFGEELHDNPRTEYVKGPPPRDFDPSQHFCQDDVFHYKRILVPKKSVYLVNSIFLDARRKYLTYRSSACMYKALRYYEKVKKSKFHFRHDYSKLKRKLFADLNRTHDS